MPEERGIAQLELFYLSRREGRTGRIGVPCDPREDCGPGDDHPRLLQQVRPEQRAIGLAERFQQARFLKKTIQSSKEIEHALQRGQRVFHGREGSCPELRAVAYSEREKSSRGSDPND